MLNGNSTDAFHQDLLAFLDRSAELGVPTATNEYCLGDPVDARAVLRNVDARYLDHADFFHTRDGYLEPRSTQLPVLPAPDRSPSLQRLLDTIVEHGSDRLAEKLLLKYSYPAIIEGISTA